MGWYHINRTGKGICLGDTEEISFVEEALAPHMLSKAEVLSVTKNLTEKELTMYDEWSLVQKLACVDSNCSWGVKWGRMDDFEDQKKYIIADAFHFCFEKRYGYPLGSFTSTSDYDGNLMIFCSAKWPPEEYNEALATLTEEKLEKQLREFLCDLTGDPKYAEYKLEMCEEYIKE